MAEFLSLHDAVARHLRPGDTVAFEGFTHLIPHAAAHEAIRQGIGELTLVRMTPDIIYDQMIGMGLAKKVVFSYAIPIILVANVPARVITGHAQGGAAGVLTLATVAVAVVLATRLFWVVALRRYSSASS